MALSYHQQRAQRLKDANLCQACGKEPPEGDTSTCRRCKDKNEKCAKKRRKKKKALRVCHNHPSRPCRPRSTTQCEECYQKKNQARREKVAANLCYDCNEPAEVGQKRCAKHLALLRACGVMRTARRKKAGVCTHCEEASLPGRRYCEKHRAKAAATALLIKTADRRDAMDHYGGPRCCLCGWAADARALQFDHINDDGAHRRRNDQTHNKSIGTWLRRNGYPAGIVQVVCANCNVEKEIARRVAKVKPEKTAKAQKVSDRQKRQNVVLRIEAFMAYGGFRCRHCGYDKNPDILQLDHIDGGGEEHRRDVHGKIYRNLKKRGFPAGLMQPLCPRCHAIKTIEDAQNLIGETDRVDLPDAGI